MIPTPTEIKYFLEVYHVKHISKAALRLGITQPTLTQSLQKLEEKLNAKLFYRTKQGVVPTEQAIFFYGSAKKLEECWQGIQWDVLTSQTEISGSFTVGCHPSVAAYTAPQLFENLTRNAPQISVQFIHDFSRKILEKIVSFEVDIGYIVNPFKHPDLVFKKLGDDRVTFWKKQGVTNLPKRIFADGQRPQMENLLGKTFKEHFRDWKIVSSTSMEVIRTLINEGQGIGILPERVALAENHPLELYDKRLPSRHDEIFLAYRKEVMSTKVGREFIKLATVKL